MYYKRFDDAINMFKKYFKIANWLPEKADAFYLMAQCYWHTNRGEEARQSCLMALNINSNFKANRFSALTSSLVEDFFLLGFFFLKETTLLIIGLLILL